MKRISTILLSLCLISTLCVGQQKGVSGFVSESNRTKIDTVVNATTKSQILQTVNPATVLSIQVTATKLTGTTAGVVRLFGSNDNEAWERITATGTLSAADSLVLTNISTPQTKFFRDNPSRYLWYKVTVQGSGTATTKFKTTAVSAR